MKEMSRLTGIQIEEIKENPIRAARDTPIEEWIKALRQYIRHIHINDNDLRRDLHLAVGDGRIDWELFCRYYQTYFEECSVLIETTKPDNQRRSLEYLRKKL